jgi:hypothetical protein
MPYLVNGQAVPKELVRKESERIARDLRWRDIPDESKRALRIHGPAEQAAIDRVGWSSGPPSAIRGRSILI